MTRIVFIGAGSGFGAQSVVDILPFPELHKSNVVVHRGALLGVRLLQQRDCGILTLGGARDASGD